ncbi:hypothetical protein F4781DRAFT_159286 [Annulohypoxylon bovei var. microspora]|nr:hypothetical protein F4781DRAFT_159286 [Annulohypoxylon bovei var. microspora]
MPGGSGSPIEITDDGDDQYITDDESDTDDEFETDDQPEADDQDLGELLFEVKHDLLRCLNGIRTTGNVAASKHYNSFVNPGLVVADSLIPMPLVPRDAETIKNASRQAPFGKGDETVVDTSVRNTWELDHTQFKFTNPDWKDYVVSLLTDAARSLAIPKMKPQPYKLLLYEEGSFFKRHKDSEKVPGMMATMVICLPSKHDGGSVHLSHGGKNYVFETDKTSDFGLTTLSWFSDVTHEVKPLKAGYRLVLTYNIIHAGGIRVSADLVGAQSGKLRSILAKWRSRLNPVTSLVYKLEHKYTQSSLSLDNLKGRDQGVCRSLYEVGSDCGFTIFLAKMNRTQSEDLYGDYGDYGDDEEDTELEEIKTCDGRTIYDRGMDVDEANILGKIWDRKADSEDEGDFTGNESMPARLRYHDTVVIIVPTQQLHIFLPKPEPIAFISLVKRTLSDGPNNHPLQMSSLMDSLKAYIRLGIFGSMLLSELTSMAIKYKDRLLYRETVYSSLKTSDAREKVLATIVRLMKDNLKDSHEQPDWDFWLGDVVEGAYKQSLTSFQHTINWVESTFQKEDLKDLMPSFQAWKTPIPDRMIESKRELDMNDYDFLICQLFSRSKDPEWLTWFMSILSNRGSRKLLCAILRAIYDKRGSKELASAKDTCLSILAGSLKKLALKIEDFPVSGYVTGVYGPLEHLSEPASTIRDVIDVIDQGFDMGLNEQATELLDISCTTIYQFCPKSGAKSAPGPLVVRDFLRSLVSVLQKHQVTPPESFKNMFIVLLRNILVSHPPKCPKPLRGWTHKSRPSAYHRGNLQSCKDCEELDAFLRNADQEVHVFRMAEYRRRHLRERLPLDLFDCQADMTQKPQRFIVRKLGKEFKQEMTEYKISLNSFEDNVRILRCEWVKSLLGEDLYDELILLKNIPESDGAQLVKRAEKRKPEEEPEGSIASRPRVIE